MSQLLLCELVTTILLSQEYSVDCSVTHNFVYIVGGTVSNSPRRRKACRQSDTSETMFWTCSTFAFSACQCEPSRFSSSSLCFCSSTGAAPFGRGSQTSGVVEAKDHVSHGRSLFLEGCHQYHNVHNSLPLPQAWHLGWCQCLYWLPEHLVNQYLGVRLSGGGGRPFLPTLPSRPQLRLCVAPRFNSRQVFHNLCVGRSWKGFSRRRTRAVLGVTSA